MKNWQNPYYPNAHKTIVFDFDGVIHKNSKGFHDGTIYDEPIDGCRKVLKDIKKRGYYIAINSCKLRKDRPLVNGKTGLVMMIEWLKKHNLYNCIDIIESEKTPGFLYIDDKALQFEEWTAFDSDMLNWMLGKEKK